MWVSQRVSFHYLPSNRKYRLRNRVAPRFRNTRGLSLDDTQGRKVLTLMSSCKTRHRCAWSRMPDLYAIFLSLLFFIPFLHAMWKMREKKRSAAIVKSIAYSWSPFALLLKNNVHWTCIYQMRRVNPRIIREAEHRLNEEME